MLVPYNRQYIEVNVSDRVYAGTIFKQKARLERMEIVQREQDSGTVVRVYLTVDLYANDNGAYGEKVSGKGIASYSVTLTADNDCAVDPTTGEVKYIREITQRTPQWLAELAAKQEPLMLQGNFFEALMHTQPVEMVPMLTSFITLADTPMFSKFQ